VCPNPMKDDGPQFNQAACPTIISNFSSINDQLIK